MMTARLYSMFMRQLALMLTSLVLCCSCIDTYEAELPVSDQQYLVIEGSICGESINRFYLSRSLSLSPESVEIRNRHVSDATVRICGSDQSVIAVPLQGNGCYQVYVGTLNASTEYWLEVLWEGRTYTSKATTPLHSPDIKDLTYNQPREDQQVDILITPARESDADVYLIWDYAEDWEIQTPYSTDWEYDPASDSIVRQDINLSLGYCKDYSHPSIIGNNIDFVNHEIKHLRLYSLDNMDNRFNSMYCTTISQRAITKEQYEYENLKLRQSDDMGGLFTPQPSELPTNIRCSESHAKVIGYVGVTLNAAQRRLYITRSSVGYKIQRIPKIPTDDELAEFKSNLQIYNNGYRILDYDEFMGTVTWIERWGIDCRVWGASLERPDFWMTDYVPADNQ